MVSDEALWTFTFLNLADISTTLAGLKRGAYEANPIARWFIEKLGLKSLFAFKYLLMGLSLLYAFTAGGQMAEQIIWIWNIVLSAVVGWNSYINIRLMEKEKREEKREKG